MPDLEADAPRADRDADAAENERARRGPVAAKQSRKIVGTVLDAGAHGICSRKLSGLAVAPGQTPTPAPMYGSMPRAMPERQEAHRRRERHDPQLDLLFDLGAVVVHEIEVDRANSVRANSPVPSPPSK